MENKETIVFDFDGTIADTIDLVLKIYNGKIVPKFNTKKINPVEFDYLREQGLNKKLLKRYNISLLKFPFVLNFGRKEIKKKVQNVRPILGVGKVIKELADKGYSLGILSSNSEENIKHFLIEYKLLQFFDLFYCNSPILRKQKNMRKLLRQEGLRKENVFYIGDEVGDIVSAKRVGIKTIAVSWGLNTRDALAKQTPDYIIDTPFELLNLI